MEKSSKCTLQDTQDTELCFKASVSRSSGSIHPGLLECTASALPVECAGSSTQLIQHHKGLGCCMPQDCGGLITFNQESWLACYNAILSSCRDTKVFYHNFWSMLSSFIKRISQELTVCFLTYLSFWDLDLVMDCKTVICWNQQILQPVSFRHDWFLHVDCRVKDN